jgi:hypothetical protein
MIHVFHHFHPAGHGTFFSSVVQSDSGEKFCWVYDCGSKWPSSLKASIKALESWENWAQDSIDLLIISHFDDDHINGLEELLSSRRAKTLVIPYLNLKDRLELASGKFSNAAVSPTVAAFSLDPIGFLISRGLASRIDSLVTVTSDGESRINDGFDPLPTINRKSGEQSIDNVDWQKKIHLFPRGSRRRHFPVLEHRSHKAIGSTTLSFELLFFNSALKNDSAPISGQPLSNIARDAVKILKNYQVLGAQCPPVPGWQKQLKALYDLHFGKSGKRRNAISLCVMFRPVGSDFSSCRYFKNFPQPSEVSMNCLQVDHERNALLLTGDLRLDAESIRQIEFHFGSWRWRQIALLQIPHHGSRHSWDAGNSELFPNPTYIHCVPNRSEKHPHETVTADLAKQHVVAANYVCSIVSSFHFKSR